MGLANKDTFIIIQTVCLVFGYQNTDLRFTRLVTLLLYAKTSPSGQHVSTLVYSLQLYVCLVKSVLLSTSRCGLFVLVLGTSLTASVVVIMATGIFFSWVPSFFSFKCSVAQIG